MARLSHLRRGTKKSWQYLDLLAGGFGENIGISRLRGGSKSQSRD